MRKAREIYGVSSEHVARRLGIAVRTLLRKEILPLQQQRIHSAVRYAQALGGRLEMWIVMPDGTGVELKVDEQG